MVLNDLLPFLFQFLEKKIDILTQLTSPNPTIQYYFKENIRYWNKLKYIIQKSFIASKYDENIEKDEVHHHFCTIFFQTAIT